MKSTKQTPNVKIEENKKLLNPLANSLDNRPQTLDKNKMLEEKIDFTLYDIKYIKHSPKKTFISNRV